MKIACVDLFSGPGGLSLGLQQAGIPVVLGVDADASCRHPYEYNLNIPFASADVRKLTLEDLPASFHKADVRILAGCAPCQPFSTYTQGRLRTDDHRWSLLAAFSQVVSEACPEIVTMENVWKLTKHVVFEEFVDFLQRMGYTLAWWKADCRLFGIPQTRTRLVLVAARNCQPTTLQSTHGSPDTWCTVREFIGHLPHIKAGEQDSNDPLHISSSLSGQNLARIRESTPGGSWRDWPSVLIAECHRRESGSTYPGVYGRMRWDAPAPTITGQCYGFGNGRFGHPSQDRAISLREAALLQTFPEEYQFVPFGARVRMKSIGQMIGNAVPPALGRAIGRSILQSL